MARGFYNRGNAWDKPTSKEKFNYARDRYSRFDLDRAQNALGINTVDSYRDLDQIEDWLLGAAANGGGSANAEGEKTESPRDTGQYDDILGALQDDLNKANQQAEYYKNLPTQDPGISANTDLIGNLNQQFQAQLAALSKGQDERYAALEGVLTQQSQAMAQSQAMMQQQMMAAQQSYNEQLRMMQNMQKANVPEAETNAFTAQIGDQREDTTRNKENNQLSDLSILSGLGTQGSPTAGFSLA